VHTVRDRSAPGARFCLKLSISVYGPGPFGSGSLFCLEQNIIVFAVWNRSAPGAGIGHINDPGPFRSGSRFVFRRELLLTRSVAGVYFHPRDCVSLLVLLLC